MEDRIKSVFLRDRRMEGYWKISHNPNDIQLEGTEVNEWRCDGCHVTFGIDQGQDPLPPVCPVCDRHDAVRIHNVRVPWEMVVHILGKRAMEDLKKRRRGG